MYCDCGSNWNSDGVCYSDLYIGENMNKRQIIAFGGEMGSGKDTCADYLCDTYGFAKISFADNLKRAIIYSFGLTHAQCYDQKLKKKPFAGELPIKEMHIDRLIEFIEEENHFILPHGVLTTEQRNNMKKHIGKAFRTPREVLQYFGTNIIRHEINPDYHADYVKAIMDRNGWDKVTIPDCRFGNEKIAVNNWGGLTVEVVRPDEQNEIKSGTDADKHESETSLKDGPPFNYLVRNDSTLSELYSNVASILRLEYPEEYNVNTDFEPKPEIEFNEDGKVYFIVPRSLITGGEEDIKFEFNDELMNQLVVSVQKQDKAKKHQ